MITSPRRTVIILLATLLSFCSLPAQENTTPAPQPSPELTLTECINRALQKNFDLAVGHYNPEIAKDNIAVAKGGYEPTLSLTGSHGENHTNSNGITSDSTDLRVGVTQQLYTGTTLSVSSNLNRNGNNATPLFGVLNPAYNADVTISARQSLFKGAGLAVNEASLHRAEIGLARANLDFKTQALTVIQNTETAYYNLAFAREQLTVFNQSYTLANRLFDEAKTRRDTGVATDLDVLQAEVGVANARGRVNLAQQTVKDRQDALLALIGQFELDDVIGTVRFPEVSDNAPVYASSYEMAKTNQPDYLSSVAAIEQYKLDLLVAKNSTKSDLSVGAAIGLNGYRGTGGTAFNDAVRGQNNSWQVDFAYNLPWGKTADKARYRQSLATLNREQVRLRQIEQTISVQVRSAVRSVETNLEAVKIATLGADLSQKQYELEFSRLEAGLSTSYRVLQAQTDLETARVNQLQARVTLNTAISGLHRLEGSSLQRYNTTLP